MSTTGFYTHPAYLEHDTGSAHPERALRLTHLLDRLDQSGLRDELTILEAPEAALADVTAVHPSEHVERVRAGAADGPCALDGDTTVSPGSWSAALRAAGASVEAVERVLDGTLDNAFCAVRPPGHHAERDRAMGFCLFNNVAVAARTLLDRHGLERVAIFDWDVHHGNGTQHIFDEEPRVFYASMHQWPLYPGTGAAGERGRRAGEGTTLNVPMAAGTGNAVWLRAFEEQVLTALEEFAPEFLLISAGFDAHRLDPLAGLELDEEAYEHMTSCLLELAQRTASGRVVSLLEGGYHLEALASSTLAHLARLRQGEA